MTRESIADPSVGLYRWNFSDYRLFLSNETMRSHLWFYLFGSVFIAAALYWIAFAHDPTQTEVLPPCTLYRTTGFLCAGCGGTRSIAHLLHGRFGEAARCNALFVFGLAFCVLYGSAYGLSRLSGRLLRKPGCFSMPTIRYTPWTATILVLIVLGFMIIRNIPVYPMTLLAPASPPPPSRMSWIGSSGIPVSHPDTLPLPVDIKKDTAHPGEYGIVR
ncbi:MAG TPA: hypothetical protein DEB39_05125 [Planctomycetaceae bacterium]|nr:hypothetical protein [Planctomycetaceae bacterium]